MYLKRSSMNNKLPLPRKGTKYVARASSHVKNGVPLVVAIRDMLHLANTSKEVNEMIKESLIKINGKLAKDIRESIRLFNILEVGKTYRLIILQTGRFSFEQVKENNRIAKVTSKTIVSGGKVQLNLHDGSNVISNEKIAVGDSIEIDLSSKINRVIPFSEGRKAFVISGKNIGKDGVVEKIENGKALIKFQNIDLGVELDKSHVIVI